MNGEKVGSSSLGYEEKNGTKNVQIPFFITGFHGDLFKVPPATSEYIMRRALTLFLTNAQDILLGA